MILYFTFLNPKWSLSNTFCAFFRSNSYLCHTRSKVIQQCFPHNSLETDTQADREFIRWVSLPNSSLKPFLNFLRPTSSSAPFSLYSAYSCSCGFPPNSSPESSSFVRCGGKKIFLVADLSMSVFHLTLMSFFQLRTIASPFDKWVNQHQWRSLVSFSESYMLLIAPTVLIHPLLAIKLIKKDGLSIF